MAGQDRGGNEGFSGTPMWKIKEQMAQYRQSVAAGSVVEEIEYDSPPLSPNIIVDTVSVGGPADGKNKFVRSVLVKDFHKIASRLKIDLPKTNVFKDKAPCALYALFDGQSCAGEPGVKATEFCARNFHTKVLENLANLPANHANDTFVKAALIKSFEDLDQELLKTQPDVQDGCGAAVMLLVGDIAFTAVLGRCNVVLCEANGLKCKAVSLGGSQREITSLEERSRLKQAGVVVIGDGAMARLRHHTGALSPVGRSLGDPQWKGAAPIISCSPEVQSTTLRGHESHPFFLLLASSITAVLESQQLVDLAQEFRMKPRAACGEITQKVLQVSAGAHFETQYSAVGVSLLPARIDPAKEKEGLPPAKKAKVGISQAMSSVRLRHILVKFVDSSAPKTQIEAGLPGQYRTVEVMQVDGKGRKLTRTRTEAEALLRRAIRDMQQELRLMKMKRTPKDVAEKVSMESKKFAELCREMSDCQTAQKGGAMCGDLGWISSGELLKMGANFKENVDALQPGMWSDITQSNQGLHFIQKVA